MQPRRRAARYRTIAPRRRARLAGPLGRREAERLLAVRGEDELAVLHRPAVRRLEGREIGALAAIFGSSQAIKVAASGPIAIESPSTSYPPLKVLQPKPDALPPPT